MAKRSLPQTTSEAIVELQTALDMQDAAEKLVATKLARLATLLSSADVRRTEARRRQKKGPVLVVSNQHANGTPISNTAA